MMKRQQGFTLIELLVVIAIIGVLASVVLVSLNGARAKARDAKRAGDIRQIKTALELYYSDNSSYPVAAAWFGGTGNCWGTITDTWIPNLSNYIARLPLDPKPTDCGSVYVYASDGRNFKVIAHAPENCEATAYKNIKDPARDGGSNPAIVDGNFCWGWSFYTPAAVTL